MQGDFEIGERLIQPRINSIQYKGVALHLEPKVMQVLLVLASKPGEVFTREEIREVVWRDVFVGDDVLMRAVSEIRRAFEDNPQTPHTIQTVPKVGYRLIAPVSETVKPIASEVSFQAPISKTAALGALPVVMAHPAVVAPAPVSMGHAAVAAPSTGFRFWAAAAGVLVVLAAVFAAMHLRSGHTSVSAASYVSHPLTTFPGSQLQPALSPGGDAVAFVWNQSGHEGHHLYVKALKSGAPVRVTTGQDQEFSPAWSPDGLSLAFIRQSATGSTVDIVPALGGSERQVYSFLVNSVGEYGGLTWSADGSNLIFPEQRMAGAPTRLVELSLATHSTRELTTPPSNWNGDSMPAVSADGKWLAFTRGSEQSTRDIFLMKLVGGTPKQLTTDAHVVLGLAWTADGSNIVFSSDRGGSLALWRISRSGDAPERVLAGTDGAYWPTISRKGDFLAYCHGSASWSVASVPLGSAKLQQETDVLMSSEQDSSPSISPAGNGLAFQSWRSGNQEIWTATIDGNNPTQLTSQGAFAGSPAWSRDGRFIAFDARPEGFAHIYITDTGGASPRALTSGSFNDIVPSWSADDRWVYFGSNRSGTWQIWRVAVDGEGNAKQVTSRGGMVAKPSLDGRWIYYSRAGTQEIWRSTLDGSAEQRVFDRLPPDDPNYWTVAGDQLFALSTLNGHPVLVQVNTNNGQTTQLYKLVHDPAPFAGLTVSSDGKQILFSELLEAKSNLTLVERFQ